MLELHLVFFIGNIANGNGHNAAWNHNSDSVQSNNGSAPSKHVIDVSGEKLPTNGYKATLDDKPNNDPTEKTQEKKKKEKPTMVGTMELVSSDSGLIELLSYSCRVHALDHCLNSNIYCKYLFLFKAVLSWHGNLKLAKLN